MKTLEEWTTASITENAANASFNDAFNTFIDNWEYHQELIFDAVDVIKALIKNDSSKERCITASKHFHWKSMSAEALVEIVSMVINWKYGIYFIKKILGTEKLADIKYFRRMFEELNTVNIPTINFIFQEIDNKGRYFDDGQWWELAMQLTGKTTRLLSEIDDVAAWQDMVALVEQDQWKELHPWFARELSLCAFDNEHGHLLLAKTIPLKVLLYKDFMEYINELSVTPAELRWEVRRIILETEHHRGFSTLWNQVFKKIFYCASHDYTYNLYHGIKGDGFQHNNGIGRHSTGTHRFH